MKYTMYAFHLHHFVGQIMLVQKAWLVPQRQLRSQMDVYLLSVNFLHLVRLFIHEYSDMLSFLLLGIGLGFLAIVVLSYFPGEPFDYEVNLSYNKHCPESRNEMDHAIKKKEQLKELDSFVGELKLEKLQELLGLEKQELDRLVKEAKQDAANGTIRPMRATNMQIADRVFYVTIIVCLAYALFTEYGINCIDYLAYMFPREANTIKKFGAMEMYSNNNIDMQQTEWV